MVSSARWCAPRWTERVLRRIAAGCALVLSALLSARPVTAAETECRVRNLAYAVRCGSVAQVVGGQRLELAYVRVPARARLPYPDPVYFIAGGPGQSATHLVAAMTGVLARLNNRRDLVFVDVRGTGRSAPLDCPGEGALTLSERLDEAAMRAHTQRCAELHRDRPLQQYGTPGAAADIEAVRATLGHDRINIVAASYGTRVALGYHALHPQHVRAMVLDGVLPPDHSLSAHSARYLAEAWQTLLRECAADSACASLEPESALGALLEAPPAPITVRNPVTGETEHVVGSARMALALVRTALHAPVARSALPAALARSRDGDLAPLLALASSVWHVRGTDGFARGAHLATVCNEDATLPPPAAEPPPSVFDRVTSEGYQAQCDQWRRPGAPPIPPIRPASEPVLLLSGALDPVTPPSLAQRVAEALGSQVRHLVSPSGGHGLLAAGCTRDLIHRFIDAGPAGLDAAPGTGCLTRTPRPPFYAGTGR